MRSSSALLVLVAASILTLSSSASAQPTKKSKKPTVRKEEPALPPPPVETAQPTPQPAAAAPIIVDVPPAPLAAPTTTKQRDRVEKPEAEDDDEPNAGPGFVGNLNLGGEALVGELVSDASLGAGFTTLNPSAGYYVTQHFGLFGGIKLGFGAAWDCSAECTTATTFQIPVTMQYALSDRTRGAYFDGGLGILSTVTLNMKSDRSVSAMSPIDAKFGAGYRWKSRQGAITQSMDLHLGFDIGQYSSLTATVRDSEVSADVPSNAKAVHAAVSFGVGWQF